MPPIASLVSAQFTSIPASGNTPMVLCSHCQTTKLPRNNLTRKEEHLKSCASFALSPLSTQRDANGRTLLEDSIARRAGRTKPGNSNKTEEEKEVLRLRRLGAVLAYGNVGETLQEGIQERVERILRGESGMVGARGVERLGGRASTTPYQPSSLEDGNQGSAEGLSAFATPEFETPSAGPATSNQSMAVLLESATRGNSTLPSPLENSRKRQQPSDFEDSTPQLNNRAAKRFKHAELYLDEDDLVFVGSAQTPREERFAALVERLARLVRLRDMR
ncbi:uncharacterized protein M437DRAFT_72987 [Aureobasidium melanogenum CBS 110374]|uniref:Uncharacterized protein n=1 Tax=Aureobasidium melanogenum (strain CBS 110374) TaxID=1043003 RepID=A0A074VX51_AURM1|nr:uncharacterized protein M437DRAFT_72987 [Aureobasidium melanogenum CBS 110374]KEQ65038.1 hypothetical protein M437DRAFT_72987 [Aureobasidium melanogenum CBS 110374]